MFRLSQASPTTVLSDTDSRFHFRVHDVHFTLKPIIPGLLKKNCSEIRTILRNHYLIHVRVAKLGMSCISSCGTNINTERRPFMENSGISIGTNTF